MNIQDEEPNDELKHIARICGVMPGINRGSGLGMSSQHTGFGTCLLSDCIGFPFVFQLKIARNVARPASSRNHRHEAAFDLARIGGKPQDRSSHHATHSLYSEPLTDQAGLRHRVPASGIG